MDILSNLEELRKTGAEFLLIDLQTALTFTDLARSSTQAETKERNRKNAAHACRSISRLLEKAKLTPGEAEAASKLMTELKKRLEELGEPV